MSEIDPENKTVTAAFPEDVGLDRMAFQIPYDILILGTAACHQQKRREPKASLVCMYQKMSSQTLQARMWCACHYGGVVTVLVLELRLYLSAGHHDLSCFANGLPATAGVGSVNNTFGIQVHALHLCWQLHLAGLLTLCNAHWSGLFSIHISC